MELRCVLAAVNTPDASFPKKTYGFPTAEIPQDDNWKELYNGDSKSDTIQSKDDLIYIYIIYMYNYIYAFVCMYKCL